MKYLYHIISQDTWSIMEKEIEKPLNSEVADISEVAVFIQYDMAIAYMNW